MKLMLRVTKSPARIAQPIHGPAWRAAAISSSDHYQAEDGGPADARQRSSASVPTASTRIGAAACN
jgi:hypothetical protein